MSFRCAAAPGDPGGDQQQRGGIGAGAVQAEQARRAGGDQRADQLIEAAQLGVQELDAPAQIAQRDPGRITGHVARPGAQRRDRGGQRGRGMPGEPGPQPIRAAGPVSARAWPFAWVRSARAPRPSAISARTATRRAVTAPRRPRTPARPAPPAPR